MGGGGGVSRSIVGRIGLEGLLNCLLSLPNLAKKY